MYYTKISLRTEKQPKVKVDRGLKKDFIPKKIAIFSHIHTNQCETRWTVSFFKFVPDTLTWFTRVGGEPMALVLDNQVLCICTSCYSENSLEVSGTYLLFIFFPISLFSCCI